MESVLRAVVIYLFLMLVFRISGKRTLAQMTAFDVVLVLVISEAVSQPLTGDDYSLTTAMTLVSTLVMIELGFAFLKQKSNKAERWIDDVPLIVVEDGKPLRERMDRARVDEEDVLECARASQGLENMQQIKYAVLERDGTISIIPQQSK